MAEKKLKVWVSGWLARKGYNDVREFECICLGTSILSEVFRGQFHKTYTARIRAWWLTYEERTRFKDKASAKAWVEQQLGITEDRTAKLEGELADYKATLKLAAVQVVDTMLKTDIRVYTPDEIEKLRKAQVSLWLELTKAKR